MNRMKWPITGRQYIKGFFVVVLLLALVRLVFPEVTGGERVASDMLSVNITNVTPAKDSMCISSCEVVVNKNESKSEDKVEKHPIYSVPSFSKCFPDDNDVQMTSAKRLGVTPVENREDAERRMHELVFMDSSPYYSVDPLTSSIPYLVPEAALLLNDIGRAFFDSLQVKGIPLHRLIVTSVLRTSQDIRKLRRSNVNATENSCHLYGTTFDISYLRYQTVSPPDEQSRRMVRNDTLKWVLSEVLRDMRESGRCHVKYERKQACFHTTVSQ